MIVSLRFAMKAYPPKTGFYVCTSESFHRSKILRLHGLVKCPKSFSTIPQPSHEVWAISSLSHSQQERISVKCYSRLASEEENEFHQKMLESLLKSNVWSLEEWQQAQDVLNRSFNFSAQCVCLILHAVSLEETATSAVQLSLQRSIQLWCQERIIRKHRTEVGSSMSSGDWMNLTENHPGIFQPLSFSCLNSLLQVEINQSRGMAVASLIVDRMIAFVNELQLDPRQQPTRDSLVLSNAILKMLRASSNDADAMIKYFSDYRQYLDERSYHVVFFELARHGRGEEAERLVDELCKGECVDAYGCTIPMNINIFNMALSAWSNNSSRQAPERAQAILRRLYDPYDWGGLGFSPDSISWNTVLKAWAQSTRHDAISSALNIFREMQEYGKAGMLEAEPDVIAFGTVLNALAKNGQPEVAERLWLDLFHEWVNDPNSGFQPTWITATPILHAWASSKHEDRIVRIDEWYQRMADLIPETAHSSVHNLLLICYSSVHTVEAAEKGEKKLLNLRTPDFAAFSIVIHHWARLPNQLHRAEILFSSVLQRFRDGDASCQPETKSLCSIIQTICKVDTDKAAYLLETVLHDVRLGLYEAPRIQTFGFFMLHYKKKRSTKSALAAMDLVNKMTNLHNSGVLPFAPDHQIYHSLIELWTAPNLRVKNPAQTALKLLRNYRGKFLKGELKEGPSTALYTLVINAMIRSFNLLQAQHLLEEMIEFNCHPSYKTFHTVSKGWSLLGNEEALQRILALLERMTTLGFPPDTNCYNNLIECFVRLGSPDRASVIFNAMKSSRDERMQPSTTTYECVMKSWLNQDLSRAHSVLEEYHRECLNGKFTPNERIYQTMIRAWNKEGLQEQVDLIKSYLSQVQNSNIVFTGTGSPEAYIRSV